MIDSLPPKPMTASELEQFRARQRSRNRVLGLILLALVVLFFAISIVKISALARLHA
jgi:hypothetical protein